MNTTTQTALLNLFDRHTKIWKTEKNSLPLAPFEDDWVSECQIEKLSEDMISWQAVPRLPTLSLNNIESALQVTLHPSITDFFCSFYSAGIPCLFEGHPVELIQAWNEADFNLLQENMIAHFMMQKKLNKPASMFIASCSDEMQIISILNETGEVQLETLGKKQEAVLAPSLRDFLDKLIPVIAFD